MRIYMDLDDCLIHSLPDHGSQKRIQVRVGDENYRVIVRPLAQQILEDCRAMAPVILLTSATKQYAEVHNDRWGFGFKPEELLSLRDVTIEVKGAYGAKSLELLKRNIDPDSVLIDNQDPLDESARAKRMLLGIHLDPTRYIKIREFNGKDPSCFAGEWKTIVEGLKTRLPKHNPQPTQEKTKERRISPPSPELGN